MKKHTPRKPNKNMVDPNNPDYSTEPKSKTIRELVFDTICESENGLTPKQIQIIIKRQPRRIREHTSTLKVEGKITEEHCRCGSNIPIYRKA